MGKLLNYKNIVFDLGNVIVKLDSEGCKNAFIQLGFGPYLDGKSHPESIVLMHKLGLGLISTEEFCDSLRALSRLNITNKQIIDAANVMLSFIPHEKLDKLLYLRSIGKTLFLLSNTIDIHWDYCVERLFHYNNHTVSDYFDSVFLSQRMHLEKPDPKIFIEVERQTGIDPDETLFIDDLPQNCESAQKTVGWNVFQNKNFDDWMNII